jgi:uridine kinase
MSIALTNPCPNRPTSEYWTQRIEQVAHALDDLQSKRSLVLVAIDGRGGAGKSTLAVALRDRLNASVVAVDDFYRVMDEAARFDLGPEAGYMQYVDWQRLQSQLLASLRRNEPAWYERFDWLTRQLGSTAQVSPFGVVLVEGVGSFRPELRSFYDFSIYVETPLEVCTTRLQARGDSEDWIERWNAAQAWYERHHNPAPHVDVIIE